MMQDFLDGAYKTLVVLILPFFAWVINVERRFAQLSEVAKRVEKIDERTEKILNHLIDK